MTQPIFNIYLDFLRYHMTLIGKSRCKFVGGTTVAMYDGDIRDEEGEFLTKYSIAKEK